MVALLVAWCIWTARDRYDFWWFQPDPTQEEREKEMEERDGEVSLGISPAGLSFLRGFILSLTRKFKKSESPPGENRAMQDTANFDIVLNPPST